MQAYNYALGAAHLLPAETDARLATPKLPRTSAAMACSAFLQKSVYRLRTREVGARTRRGRPTLEGERPAHVGDAELQAARHS